MLRARVVAQALAEEGVEGALLAWRHMCHFAAPARVTRVESQQPLLLRTARPLLEQVLGGSRDKFLLTPRAATTEHTLYQTCERWNFNNGDGGAWDGQHH